MSKALVIYASTHGHTCKIAERIGATLRSAGHDADVLDVERAAATDPRDYGLVLVGASVHAGHHQKSVGKWLRDHAQVLNGIPSGFFSVSLTAADDSGEAREMTAKLAREFTDEAGWQPGMTVRFAGALQYREYDFFTRLLMRMIAKRHGQSTDTHADVDYTDWDAVEAFAAEMAAVAFGSAAMSPHVSA
jgi:menaquinone-dependent protoporphyrinogen oxidase